MSQFTYESQGAETVLVCQLEEQEHIDSFAKGMLQSNDIAGLVKPSYSQRDTNQYLKYPVTSKIPLKDLLTVEIDRKDALKLCLSIANAAKEMEEYMLSPEKLMLGLEYVFVDVRKKEVSLCKALSLSVSSCPSTVFASRRTKEAKSRVAKISI